MNQQRHDFNWEVLLSPDGRCNEENRSLKEKYQGRILLK